MELSISYYVVFGKCDESDCTEYNSIELSDDEARAALPYALTNDFDSILDLPELTETQDQLRSEIEEQEIEINLENEDEYTMECQGTALMDPDELNEMVQDRDYRAIEYFGLEDLTEDELDEWDANDLDELPTIAEFDPDFEPCSPFDEGWELKIVVTDVDVSEYEFTEYIEKLFEENDVERIEDIVDNCAIDFGCDVREIVLDMAEKLDCQEIIDYLA